MRGSDTPCTRTGPSTEVLPDCLMGPTGLAIMCPCGQPLYAVGYGGMNVEFTVGNDPPHDDDKGGNDGRAIGH